MSNCETEQILALVANHMRFGDVEKMRDSTLKRFFRLDRFDEHLALHRMDCMASHRDFRCMNLRSIAMKRCRRKQIRPQPLMTGDDLIALGFGPARSFKQC